jgi:hypothetical protein
MTLVKKIKDKKVNFEFNKEYIKVVTEKISTMMRHLLQIRLMKCTHQMLLILLSI